MLARWQAREAGRLLQDKQALEGRLREMARILATVQDQRNELKQQYKARPLAELSRPRVPYVIMATLGRALGVSFARATGPSMPAMSVETALRPCEPCTGGKNVRCPDCSYVARGAQEERAEREGAEAATAAAVKEWG